jgi:hypothetical protein
MISFARAYPNGKGWRYSGLDYRTRREGDGWTVQCWNGQEWEHVEGPSCITYENARELATSDQESREAA